MLMAMRGSLSGCERVNRYNLKWMHLRKQTRDLLQFINSGIIQVNAVKLGYCPRAAAAAGSSSGSIMLIMINVFRSFVQSWF